MKEGIHALNIAKNSPINKVASKKYCWWFTKIARCKTETKLNF